MAVETYGLVAADTYPFLPFDTSDISSTSKVTPTDLGEFIERGAAGVTTAFMNQGVSYESLNENIQADVQRAILSYAAYCALQKLGYSSTRQDALLRTYEEQIARIRTMAGAAGNAPETVYSNIDVNNVPARRFTRTKGW